MGKSETATHSRGRGSGPGPSNMQAISEGACATAWFRHLIFGLGANASCHPRFPTEQPAPQGPSASPSPSSLISYVRAARSQADSGWMDDDECPDRAIPSPGPPESDHRREQHPALSSSPTSYVASRGPPSTQGAVWLYYYYPVTQYVASLHSACRPRPSRWVGITYRQVMRCNRDSAVVRTWERERVPCCKV